MTNIWRAGAADRSANTTPGNKRGGLANIVEKALGSRGQGRQHGAAWRWRAMARR